MGRSLAPLQALGRVRSQAFHSCLFVACRAVGSAKADPFAVRFAERSTLMPIRVMVAGALVGTAIFNGCF
jgi:hypothetical protein